MSGLTAQATPSHGMQMAREALVERNETIEAPPQAMNSVQAAEIAARAGYDKKAEDVVVLDVRGLASYADFLVLMTASSERQVNAVADAVDDALRKSNYRPIGVEGLGAGSWILIDAGDVVVHVFHTDARGFYDIDRLWSDAKRLRVEPTPRTAVPA